MRRLTLLLLSLLLCACNGLCCTNQARSVLELAVLNLTTHH